MKLSQHHKTTGSNLTFASPLKTPLRDKSYSTMLRLFTMLPRPKKWVNPSILFCNAVLLTACGGSGGSSDNVKIDDTSPDAFQFKTKENAALSSVITSDTLQISGINTLTRIEILGGEYAQVVDGVPAKFMNVGFVANNDIIVVRGSSSASHSAKSNVQILIGDQQSVFTVETLPPPPDINPDPFELPDILSGATPGEAAFSGPVSILGIDSPSPIAIEGGEYKINEGEFLSTPGNIQPGDTVTVKVMASSDPEGRVEATLTIGDISETFIVNNAFAPPEATIVFPPKVSMTAGSTLRIRGTASDADSEIESITIDGGVSPVPATLSKVDDEVHWIAEVTLSTNTENRLSVTTIDSDGNPNIEETAITITQAPLSSAYPNANNELELPSVVQWDASRNRLLVSDRGPLPQRYIYAVDLENGERTLWARPPGAKYGNARSLNIFGTNVFTSSWEGNDINVISLNYDLSENGPEGDNAFPEYRGQIYAAAQGGRNPEEMTIDKDNLRLINVDSQGASGKLFSVSIDPENADRTLERLDNPPMSFSPEGVAYIPQVSERAPFILSSIHTKKAATGAEQKIYHFPSEGGAQSVWWDNTDKEMTLRKPSSIAYDSANDQLLVTDVKDPFDIIYGIDIDTKAIRIISDSGDDRPNPIGRSDNIYYDPELPYLLVTDFDFDSVVAIDPETGERVFITKADTSNVPKGDPVTP